MCRFGLRFRLPEDLLVEVLYWGYLSLEMAQICLFFPTPCHPHELSIAPRGFLVRLAAMWRLNLPSFKQSNSRR